MMADVAFHFTRDMEVKKFCGQRSDMEHLTAPHVSYWNNKPGLKAMLRSRSSPAV